MHQEHVMAAESGRVSRTREARFPFLVGLAGIGVVAGVLRAFQLTHEALRLDEAFTIWVSDHPMARIPGLIAAMDTHPPLHYLLVAALPGSVSATGLRLLSVAFGVGAVLLAGLATDSLLRLHWPHRAGPHTSGALTAAAVVALTGFHIAMSRDGRMYAMAAFLVVATLLAAVSVLARGGPRSRLATGVLSALAALTHVTALPPVLAMLAVLFARDLRKREQAWRTAIGPAAFAVLWGPWLPGFVEQLSHSSQNLSWIAPQGPMNLLRQGGAMWLPSAPVVALVLILLVAGAAPLALGWQWPTMLVGAATLAAALTPTFVTLAVQTIPFPRSWTVLVPLLAVSVGLGTAGVLAHHRALAWAVPAIVVGLASFGVAQQALYTAQGSEFRTAAQFLAHNTMAGDLLVYVGNYGQLPMELYAPELKERAVVGFPTTFTKDPTWEAPVRPEDVEHLDSVLARHERVVLVGVRAGALDRRGLVTEKLRTTCSLQRRQGFRGVTISFFRCPTTNSSSPSAPAAISHKDG